jgi:hypothetical protein
MNRARRRSRMNVAQRRAWAISEALDRWWARFSEEELARVLAHRQAPTRRSDDRGRALKVVG